MTAEFQTLKAEAAKTHQLFLNGLATREQWLEKAEAACKLYNQIARETAKKFGVKPRLMKAEWFK